VNNEPIKAVFTYSRDEYLRAVRRHYRTHIYAVRDIVVGMIAVIAGLIIYFSDESRLYAWILIVIGLILLTMVAYAFLVLPKLMYRSDPRLKWEYSLTFYEDRIEFKTKEIDSILKWPLYHSWLGDDEFYILYHGKRNLSVIPRRALKSDNSDERFASLLERKLGPPLHIFHFGKKE